jgi:hypothetical protein
MKRYAIGLVFLLAMSYWAIRPLMGPGYYPMHDDTQVSRVIVMANALKNGQLPVRWVDGLGYGYGYPIFNFYGPLPYYAGGALHMFGVDSVTAAKVMIAAGILAAGVFMYVAAYSLIGLAGALVSSVLYVYAPYHAVQAYVRGSVGELWAYAFLPLVVYGYLARNKRHRARAVIVGALGISGVVLSHTVFGYLLGAVAAIVLILNTFYAVRNREFVADALRTYLMTVIGFGLSAFFWLPAFFEKRYTGVEGFMWDRVNAADHFLCPLQLWSSEWGFGGSAPGCTDGMSFMAGKLHILLFTAGTVLFFMFRTRFRDKPFIPAGIAITVMSVFFMVPQSVWFWQVFPNASYIQYPWRLLTVAALGSSMVSGAVFMLVKAKIPAYVFAAAISTAVVMLNAKWFQPQYTFQTDPLSYESVRDISFRASRVSDEYLPPDLKKPKDASEIPENIIEYRGDARVEYEKITETYIKAQVDAGSPVRLKVNRAYFPGWTFLKDGKVQMPEVVDGLPELTYEPGLHVFEMRFTDTPVRVLGNFLSIITGIIVIIYYGKKTYR